LKETRESLGKEEDEMKGRVLWWVGVFNRGGRDKG